MNRMKSYPTYHEKYGQKKKPNEMIKSFRYSFFFKILNELIIHKNATPTSANTAIHIFAIPRAPRISVPILINS